MSLKSLTDQHLVTHQRISRTRGTSGGATPSTSSLGTKRCRIQPRSGAEDESFESVDEIIDTFIYFDEDPQTQPRDQLVFVNGSTTHTYEVHDTVNFNMLNRLWRVACEEIKKKSR